ncbi:hypothetical protein SAMN05421890_1807 [Ensifer adhaerens]|nr:hypothetical protein SAMN05421890_1807 [Ensifer adhaerens]
MTSWFRVAVGILGATVSVTALTGCISSPTYGTNKTAAEHLVDGVGSVLDITPDTKNDKIAYQPNPKLVVPARKDQLIPPQQSVTDSKNWVESPEQTRQRLREEADQGGQGYRSPLLGQAATNQTQSLAEQRQAYREGRKIQQGIYSDKRRFLSDPPLDYRKVDQAELNDLGTPEKVKERERKKEATAAKQTDHKWWDVFD